MTREKLPRLVEEARDAGTGGFRGEPRRGGVDLGEGFEDGGAGGDDGVAG